MVAQRRTDHVEETPEIKELMGNMDHEKLYGITANISFRRKRQTVGNFYEGIISSSQENHFLRGSVTSRC